MTEKRGRALVCGTCYVERIRVGEYEPDGPGTAELEACAVCGDAGYLHLVSWAEVDAYLAEFPPTTEKGA